MTEHPRQLRAHVRPRDGAHLRVQVTVIGGGGTTTVARTNEMQESMCRAQDSFRRATMEGAYQ